MFNIDKVNERVFLNNTTNIELDNKYDIGLVLGCKNYDIMYKRVDGAIDLYNKGIIKKIIVSGGVGLFSKNVANSEAYMMKQYLIKHNIPTEDIIVEDKGKTTTENMKNILNMIDDDKSMIVITSIFHIKRSIIILKKLTNNKIYYYGVSDGICDKDKWYKNKIGKEFVRLEYLILRVYI